MARPPKTGFDPERDAHKAWLGLIQPVGLVVSPPALIKAQALLDRNVIPIQQAVSAVLERPASVFNDADPILVDFPRFATDVLGWSLSDLAGAPGGPPLPAHLEVVLPDYHETLRPTYAALDGMGDGHVLLLVQLVASGAPLDAPPPAASDSGWQASPQARFERLLRDTGVPAGLLCNGAELRLVYAPRGESSGHLGFPVSELATVGGRPLLMALHMLLSEHRVFTAPDNQRLLDLLRESRKYQSEVSSRLAEQVLVALWEILRGFQAADDAAGGRVLYNLPSEAPETVYGGLLTVIMRLVFLLYAEDQGLMPDDPVYARNYAIGGLFERLREDAGRHPDTLDQRFGAYAWLLATFRLVYDGGSHGGLRLPARHGQLFDPDAYAFLEGRPPDVARVVGDTFEAPRVSDGVIWRVLEGLLVLDGERLSYRALDVEQVGSVYESMMGFDVATLPGRALALRPKNVVVDVDALLALPAARRAPWLKEHADCDLAAGAARDLAASKTIDDVVAALGRRVAPQTVRPLPPGALFLQPGEERRRSGSHYTPRELTEPIVRTTLRPVLEALGPRPTAEQLLDLKVCDPAMGSGAFLVETCRQLAIALVTAWETHGTMPALPPDEDPLLHARRLVAQRCLYGVDKNPFAVNLAKLSLWLVTLARDHAFTFLDHALKHGDSLVGLTKAQIGAFHWSPNATDRGPLFEGVTASVNTVSAWRQTLMALGDGDYDQRRDAWREAEDELHDVRLIGDACIAAYFGAEKDKDRTELLRIYKRAIDDWKAGGSRTEVDEIVTQLRSGDRPVLPLHWEIEFPEVFGRENPGFDAMVGNPPFLGGTLIGGQLGRVFHAYLVQFFEPATGLADLVAFFFRRSFGVLRKLGALGFVSTNTVAQGDTRAAGLLAVLRRGGEIYSASARYVWPGQAAVVASVVHISKRHTGQSANLNGRSVERISAYLLRGNTDSSPAVMRANSDRGYRGTKVWGAGFVFEDQPSDGSSSLADMHEILLRQPASAEVLFPYIGAEEFNTSPSIQHSRYVIDFGEMSASEASKWPLLFRIVEERVKPVRAGNKQRNYRDNWWLHANRVCQAGGFLRNHGRMLALGSVSKYVSVAFAPAGTVIADSLVVLLIHEYSGFSAIQSSVHSLWARFCGSSMKDDLRYTPSDCFETFPFPPNWHSDPTLEAVGQRYYEFRAALMIRNNEGLTKTYNRFHDPNERDPDILTLRELHAAMDREVLDTYGWTDVPTACEFLLDYEIDEESWGDKKKPYRYRWPDAVRDDVLARLLDLNQKRYDDEVAAGLHDKSNKAAAKKPATKPKKPKDTLTGDLFGGAGEDP